MLIYSIEVEQQQTSPAEIERRRPEELRDIRSGAEMINAVEGRNDDIRLAVEVKLRHILADVLHPVMRLVHCFREHIRGRLRADHIVAKPSQTRRQISGAAACVRQKIPVAVAELSDFAIVILRDLVVRDVQRELVVYLRENAVTRHHLFSFMRSKTI